jgi:death on curing protein
MEEPHLTLADVVALHADVMRRMGAAPNPLRDEGALESAIMRARMAAYYEQADDVRQAALLAIGISQAQAFLDGNKRTALAAMYVFLRERGLATTVEPLVIARQLEVVAERTGERAAAEEAFEVWLRERVQPINA